MQTESMEICCSFSLCTLWMDVSLATRRLEMSFHELILTCLEMSSELATVYASLILADDGVEITVRNIYTRLNAF